MKLIKRTGIYKASNVTFNPTTMIAYSYDWWAFVKVIKGKLVFNNFNYSNSTIKHQSKVRGLLHELGYSIDLFIEAPNGLDRLGSAISYYQSCISALKLEMLNGRKKKNLERQQLINEYTNKIAVVEMLSDEENSLTYP